MAPLTKGQVTINLNEKARKVKNPTDRKYNGNYQELGRGGTRMSFFNGYRVSFGENEKVLEMPSGVGYSTM